MRQVHIVFPFGHNLWMDNAGLEVVYGWNEGNEAEEFVNFDLERVLFVNFAVSGIAVGPDDKENVERTVLPAHYFLLKTLLRFVWLILMC